MAQGSEKQERGAIPSVPIDGTRIRNVRESKKLTQLYVASAVGVTTDTISRWENNRYPSIRRDNAEKLASALEVDLDDILRREEPPVEPDTAPVKAPFQRRLLLWGLPLLAVAIALAVFALRPAPAPIAVRWTPKFAAPGEIVPVQIKVTRQPGQSFGFILKERLPDGLRLVASIPPSSSTEASGSGVKWLVPNGSGPVTISYTARIPASVPAQSEVQFHGEIVRNVGGGNRTEAVGGDTGIRIGTQHWADTNGDGRIDDDEIMPAYYVVEDMKGLGLDWKTIEAIWSGKGYRWDPKSGFSVVK